MNTVVACYTLSGIFKRTYTSALEASKCLHLYKRSIDKCLRGENKSAGGYLWLRVDPNHIPSKITPYQKKTTTRSIKPIALIDEDGSIIKTYPSIKKASEDNNTNTHTIRDVLTGKYHSAKGNKYRYLDKKEIEIYGYKIGEDIVKEKKAVIQLSLQGQYIKTFKSVYQASKYLNKPPKAIYDCLKGKYHTAYGYKWRYKH